MISHPPLMTRSPKLLSSLATPPNDVWGAISGVYRTYAAAPKVAVKIPQRCPLRITICLNASRSNPQRSFNARSRCSDVPSALRIAQSREMLARLGDLRLKLGVRVLPHVDELRVVVRS